MVPIQTRPARLAAVLLIIVLLVFLWSGYRPRDRFTWVLETFPVMVAIPLLAATRRRFPLTPLLYTIIALHCVILLIGGHYTYAEVPPFNWLRDNLHLSRNHFDRVGHFAQGFVPAMIARELLLRTSPLRAGKWLFTLCVCAALAVSALYELFEWQAAVMTGAKADAFLATQGDVWDTQKDMALACLGALTALLTLAWLHNRQLRACER